MIIGVGYSMYAFKAQFGPRMVEHSDSRLVSITTASEFREQCKSDIGMIQAAASDEPANADARAVRHAPHEVQAEAVALVTVHGSVTQVCICVGYRPHALVADETEERFVIEQFNDELRVIE